jgi:DNA repair exonuclease SbcCD ATPase subunit
MESLAKYAGGKCPTCLQEIRAEYFEKVSKDLRVHVSEQRRNIKEKKELLSQKVHQK